MALPDAVSAYLLALVGEERQPAFLVAGPDGLLTSKGGKLAAYGLSDVKVGEAVAGQAIFLEGMLPVGETPIFLPCVKTEAGQAADIHLFQDNGADCVLLLDAASYEIRQKLFQQRANQLSLVSESLSRWTDHQSAALGSVFAALDIAVLETEDGHTFFFLSAVPSWFLQLWQNALSPSGEVRLNGSPFLADFLKDAAAFWQSEERGYLTSGPWPERNLENEPFFIQVSVLGLGNRRILLIEHPKVALGKKQFVVRQERDQDLKLGEPDRTAVQLMRETAAEIEFPFEERTAELLRLNQLLQWELTERVKAQQQNRLMLQTLNSVTEMICVTNADDRFTYVNPSFLNVYGYTENEILGRHIRILWSPRNPPELTEQVLKRTPDGGWKGEVWNCRKDGSELPVSLSTSPICDVRSQIVGFVGIAQDLTERKRAAEVLQRKEEQLHVSQRMEAIGRLTGGISHDFSNLLTIIIGYSENMLPALAPDSELRSAAEAIHDAGTRAAELTRKLLAFSKTEILVPKVVNLNSILNSMGKLLRRVLGEDTDVRILLDPQLYAIEADPVQLEQVILNLTINAREAMPSGGRLTLETANLVLGDSDLAENLGAEPGAYAMLAVTDTGYGMDEETRARIFEPFFSTKPEGTGLGLPTVYGIVRQTKGAIFVFSEPGAGSTFKVCFPRSAEATETSVLSAHTDLRISGSEIILVIEDEDTVRSLVQKMLTSSGYQVFAVSCSAEAIKVVTEHPKPIDLILSDVVMPDTNGCDLVEKLKRLRPKSKVLFMSGYSNHAVLKRSIIGKEVAFLQKPFTTQILLQKVREVLDTPSEGEGSQGT